MARSEPEAQSYAGDLEAAVRLKSMRRGGSRPEGLATRRGAALESYVTSDGTVAFDTSAHIATGTKA